ncbi:hypothetical protein Vafri_13976 [Volvox africanus]|uniref:Uncharacterized protein n=1 Tax=Volvox africanus TaxID=51714 RepID=A0A8J4F6Y0_9CHLO|nr:hypothetical protein Vafri_13976 [Volvox africanus]
MTLPKGTVSNVMCQSLKPNDVNRKVRQERHRFSNWCGTAPPAVAASPRIDTADIRVSPYTCSIREEGGMMAGSLTSSVVLLGRERRCCPSGGRCKDISARIWTFVQPQNPNPTTTTAENTLPPPTTS